MHTKWNLFIPCAPMCPLVDFLYSDQWAHMKYFWNHPIISGVWCGLTQPCPTPLVECYSHNFILTKWLLNALVTLHWMVLIWVLLWQVCVKWSQKQKADFEGKMLSDLPNSPTLHPLIICVTQYNYLFSLYNVHLYSHKLITGRTPI